MEKWREMRENDVCLAKTLLSHRIFIGHGLCVKHVNRRASLTLPARTNDGHTGIREGTIVSEIVETLSFSSKLLESMVSANWLIKTSLGFERT